MPFFGMGMMMLVNHCLGGAAEFNTALQISFRASVVAFPPVFNASTVIAVSALAAFPFLSFEIAAATSS